MIGKLNNYIKILERKEVATRPSFADDTPSTGIDWDGVLTHTTGEEITYDVLYETWASVDYTGTVHNYLKRAVGNLKGDTSFVLRAVPFDVEKDFYIDCEGSRYKVVGSMPADNKKRFLFLDCSFITKDTDNA